MLNKLLKKNAKSKNTFIIKYNRYQQTLMRRYQKYLDNDKEIFAQVPNSHGAKHLEYRFRQIRIRKGIFIFPLNFISCSYSSVPGEQAWIKRRKVTPAKRWNIRSSVRNTFSRGYLSSFVLHRAKRVTKNIPMRNAKSLAPKNSKRLNIRFLHPIDYFKRCSKNLKISNRGSFQKSWVNPMCGLHLNKETFGNSGIVE